MKKNNTQLTLLIFFIVIITPQTFHAKTEDFFNNAASTLAAPFVSLYKLPGHYIRDLKSSFSADERRKLVSETSLYVGDYAKRYDPMIIKISDAQHFGRNLTDDEMGLFTQILHRIQLAQNNIMTLDRLVSERTKTNQPGLTDEEQRRLTSYLYEQQQGQQDFFMKELDIRYETPSKSSATTIKKEYEEMTRKLLAYLVSYQTALRKEMLSIDPRKERVELLQGIVNNITFELHYLRIKSNTEKKAHEAHKKIAETYFISSGERKKQFKEKHDKLIAEAREQLQFHIPMVRDEREPFSHSKRRARKTLVEIKDSEEEAHIENLQDNPDAE